MFLSFDQISASIILVWLYDIVNPICCNLQQQQVIALAFLLIDGCLLWDRIPLKRRRGYYQLDQLNIILLAGVCLQASCMNVPVLVSVLERSCFVFLPTSYEMEIQQQFPHKTRQVSTCCKRLLVHFKFRLLVMKVLLCFFILSYPTGNLHITFVVLIFHLS